MDKLKQYKELWNTQEISEKWNQSDLYKMMHKSSSSMVKWIFYVSVLEFTFFTILSLVFKTDTDSFKELGIHKFMYIQNILGYVFLLFFIYLFYLAYRRIRITQSVKDLMQKILRTRQIVKIYILFTLLYIFIVSVYIFSIVIKSLEYEALIEKFGLLTIWAIVISALFFIIGVIYLIYMIIYGYFIRKLKTNYNELSDEILDD